MDDSFCRDKLSSLNMCQPGKPDPSSRWNLSNNFFFRNRRLEVFCQKGVFKDFAKFTGKHLYWSFFLIKSEAWSPATLLKRRSCTSVLLWILRIFYTYFEEHQVIAASKIWKRLDSKVQDCFKTPFCFKQKQ